MSVLTPSHLRLADALREAYEDFVRAVDPAAVALAECLPDERVECAGNFLVALSTAQERYERRHHAAVADSIAREQEHAS